MDTQMNMETSVCLDINSLEGAVGCVVSFSVELKFSRLSSYAKCV